jgi:hypothetical protein
MSKKEPEPVRITKEDCYITELRWEYPSLVSESGYFGRCYVPGEPPVTEMHLTTGFGDKLRISTRNWKVDGDLRRVSTKFDKPIKLTIEIPTLTDEEVAELEAKAKARSDICKLKSEMRDLEDNTKKKLRDLQKEIDKLDKKYQ